MSKKDSELKGISDYDLPSCQAAFSCLLEVADLFDEHHVPYLVVGGWVPSVCFPKAGHTGSVDADFLLKFSPTRENLPGSDLEKMFLEAGFRKHPDAAKWFSFVKDYQVGDFTYTVDVDLLTERYGGSSSSHRGNRVQGKKLLKITGGDYAFRFPAQRIEVRNGQSINVVDLFPYLIMKTLALGDLKRNKPKDAYDIYMVLSHADYRKIQGQFQNLLKDSKNPDSLARHCLSIWGDFFDSPEGKGVNDVVSFFPNENPDGVARIRQEAYQFVHQLTSEN